MPLFKKRSRTSLHELYAKNVCAFFCKLLIRNPSWWQRRSRFERSLSLVTTIILFIAIGLAISLAAVVYRSDANAATKGAFNYSTPIHSCDLYIN